jgi:DNA primase
MATIDTDKIKRETDLLSVASRYTSLNKKANTGGGEYAGACPKCGGTDRFIVQPLAGIWLCRQCHPKFGDVIELVQYVDGVGFLDACERLGYSKSNGKKQQGALQRFNTTQTPPEQPKSDWYTPPTPEWQAMALDLIEKYERTLWRANGVDARRYLNKRGLKDDTIKHFRLGLQLGKYRNAISMPCFVNGELWYLKYRISLPPGSKADKYKQETGGRPRALYNGDTILKGKPALVLEGEFDTMLAWQEFGDILPTFTPGSTNNKIDIIGFGSYLLRPSYLLILPDNDDAGLTMAGEMCNLVKDPRIVALDTNAKDLTDYWQAGNDVRAWAVALLEWHAGLDEYYKRS